MPVTTIVIWFVICLWFLMSVLQTVRTQVRLLLVWSVSIYCLPVCKNRFEKFARIFSRRQKQRSFSDTGFLGILRVKCILIHLVISTPFLYWTNMRSVVLTVIIRQAFTNKIKIPSHCFWHCTGFLINGMHMIKLPFLHLLSL